MTISRSLAALVAAACAFLICDPGGAMAAPKVVAFSEDLPPGTIVVHTGERRLYLVLQRKSALRYTVGVGREGWQWSGKTAISGKFLHPAWYPPLIIKQESPELPDMIPGGSPANPMGVAAMTLAGGQYAIHGTNTPKLIGGFVSHGCIRMYNQDVLDLYSRVGMGTPVVIEK
jgi:lipoprotein-anchoring transpeptidase ErfK/SrfK